MPTPIPPWQRRTTALVVVLAIGSTLLGLFRTGHYPPSLLPAFYVQDLVILLVGVPALASGLRSARAGSLRGRLLWLGALAFMTYMWVSIGLQVPFNGFFLGYVALFGLSLFTFVGGVVGTDADAVTEAVGDVISERRYGAVLGLIAAGLTALWLSELVPATLSGTPPLLVADVGPQALVSHFLDLAVVVPALTVVAAWLWQGRPWGYVLAGDRRHDPRPVSLRRRDAPARGRRLHRAPGPHRRGLRRSIPPSDSRARLAHGCRHRPFGLTSPIRVPRPAA